MYQWIRAYWFCGHRRESIITTFARVVVVKNFSGRFAMDIPYDFLLEKDAVTFLWPICIDEIEMDHVYVRYLDLIESYLFPLHFGLSKQDIQDYLSVADSMDFLHFLRFKSYVSTKTDFVRYFEYLYKNANLIECYRLNFQNLGNLCIEELRTRLYNVWDNLGKNDFSEFPEGLRVEKGVWNLDSHTFCIKEVISI